MATEFKLPMVAESIVEGEIGKWLVKEGEFVKRDQPLVEVMTDKVNVEIPSPIEGYLIKIVVADGKIAKVGQAIAVFGAEGEEYAGEQEGEVGAEVKVIPQKVEFKEPFPHEVLAAPAVRKQARELGVDLEKVSGTGPSGRILAEDVERFKAQAAKPVSVFPDLEERIPLRGVRRIVAERMVNSLRTVAHTLHVDEADVTELVGLRETQKGRAVEKGIKLTYLSFIIKAAVRALKKITVVNSSLDDKTQEIVLKKYYNIGIAVATDQGLVVPVVKDADKKDIWTLATEIETLARKARAGKLELTDVQNSTFSITNVGSVRGVFSFPIINYPETAILGVHRIQKRPVVREGKIVIRDMVYLSLAFDHRVFDGAVAAGFTGELIKYLESPALLFWEET
jgi:pyruvate dehydrogenase E2 component (dihydrolipoamide acetyltransferase)